MSALPPVVVSGLWPGHHHADLHAQLVDEDHHAVAALDVAGQLAQGLAHQARLQAGELVAHLALDFGPGREGGDRVDHHHVDRVGAHQHVGDFQRLLAGIGLADQQVVDVDAELGGVGRVERVLGIDEGAGAAGLLALGDGLQRQRGLARGLRAIDLDHAALGQAADAQRDVQHQRAGADHFGRFGHLVAHAHDRALAELLFDLAQGGREGALLVLIHRGDSLGRVCVLGKRARWSSSLESG